MILKILIAAILFELISAPVICAVAQWIIGAWYEARTKFIGTITEAAGKTITDIASKNESKRSE